MEDNLIPNGGRTLTLSGSGGSIPIKVISKYSPSWKKEYTENFTAYDGKDVRLLKGIRFSLSFSTYGLTPSEMIALKNLLINSEELTLNCDEYSGAVTCEDFSPEIQSSNFLGDYTRSDVILTASESVSDGKIVTISGDGDSVKFVVFSDYSPSWTKEYTDSFTAYDGQEVKICKGVRFSLTFSPNGIPSNVLSQIENILMNSDEITLSCDEYSGVVFCDTFSADLQTPEYFRSNITLTAGNMIEGGKAVSVSGDSGKVDFVVVSDYSASWRKEYAESFMTYDGREIKPLKGVRFSLDFSPKGIPPAVALQLRDILMYSKQISLSCDEYSGNVNCDIYNSSLQSANDLGEFYSADINLTAVAASLPEDGL